MIGREALRFTVPDRFVLGVDPADPDGGLVVMCVVDDTLRVVDSDSMTLPSQIIRITDP